MFYHHSRLRLLAKFYKCGTLDRRIEHDHEGFVNLLAAGQAEKQNHFEGERLDINRRLLNFNAIKAVFGSM